MIRVAVRMAAVVEVRQVVETHAIDDERVAFPLADRIAKPCRICFLRETAAIRKNLSKVTLVLVKDYGNTRRLDDLERSGRHEHDVGYSVG